MADAATAGKDAGTKTDAGEGEVTGKSAGDTEDVGKGKPDTTDETGDTGSVKDDQLSSEFDVEEVMDEYGLDSPEDLKQFIADLSDMRGKIGENDLDTLIENTKTLQKYQAQWQEQEEARRREKETPEETIARLEKEKKDLISKTNKDRDRQKAAKAAEHAYDEFTDTVTSVISSAKELPKEYRPFLSKFMGVDNPINEVDITDKAKVRRLTKDGVKDLLKFEQEVIKRYRAGKTEIPKVTETEPDAGKAINPDTDNPKNLKEAKTLLLKRLAGK